ncbi:helix-turn-helix domain-containing protein [Conexibacter sp. DBS9H8]|uniref:helix-turn-helix domain-containing protein n=1 Tax=Conexibacter sp. DBS9H8 TaxID=2937801 RepID=UPI00200C47E4|nr:helix-turn-helix domain-containing protein [Conexibacter sp. DBS9H8]
MDRSELLTVSQAAEAFGATSQTIRNWIRAGQVDAVRIGNRFLIPRQEIDRIRGAAPVIDGDSPWDISTAPPKPLQRRGARSTADPTDGMLGA